VHWFCFKIYSQTALHLNPENMQTPAQYGLVGKTLSHSFSPAYFARKFEAEGIEAVYSIFELPQIADFPHLLVQHSNLHGLNVTVPYKKAILPFLDSLDRHAQAIGAVNCIAIAGEQLRGYNTDWTGFWQSLKRAFNPLPAGALVLGSGGAAAAVQYALAQGGIPFQTVSRNPASRQLGYAQIDTALLQKYPLLINTTPLGTAPNIAELPPVPYELLTSQNVLFDLVYNPAQTAFLKQGAAHGCLTQSGLPMLEIQAAESWNIWQDVANER
jgi:shikimate dehydrogenase